VTAEGDGDPLDLGWNASCGSIDLEGPPALRRRSSLSGNILLVNHADGEDAFFLQRKISKTTFGSVRVGFRVEQKKLQDDVGIEWDVIRSDGPYPFEMVAIKLQDKQKVTSNEKVPMSIMDPKVELSALQLISKSDLSEECRVVSAEIICTDRNTVYSIMPFNGDGSLFQYVVECGRLDEPVARHFFQQILKGLQTLRAVGLCHRNLSLENVLLSGSDCMITSLGSCLRIDEKGLLKPEFAFGATPKYLAPEIVKSTPFDGYAADLWAVGVMLCGMLFGTDAPFAWASHEDRRFVEISVKGNLKGLSTKWEVTNPNKKAKATPVSDDALDLIQNVLRAEPSDRLTLQQVLEHPWVLAKATPPVLGKKSR